MRKFTDPLDKIKIAAPCGADWNEMRGDDRKRHCAMCKLNVYNLSEMTREEAESFLINSEGRVCLRVYRRADGTVITKNCPVGLEKIKQRLSQIATATFSLLAGIYGGTFATQTILSIREKFPAENLKKLNDVNESDKSANKLSFGLTDGMVSNLPELKIEILKNRR